MADEATGNPPAGTAVAPAAEAASAAGGGRSEVLNSGSAPATPEAASSPEFTALIPAEYKDKPWIKDVKDLPGLFKRTDGLLTEMGKRPAGIPEDNAPAEKWTAFNKAFGVPEKPDGYKLAEGTAEAPVDPKFQTGIKSVFHKAGVSARQAAILEQGYNALAAELGKEKGVAAEQQNTDFTKLATDVFGARKDEALTGAQKLIAAHAPASMKTHIENLPNEQLIILAGVLDAVRKEYISEDRMPSGGAPAVGMTAEQRQAKGRELMASKPYGDPFHPDHQKVVDEVRRLYNTK